jgi:hypothetical protein
MMKKYLILFLILFFASPLLAADFYADCSVSGGTGGAGTYADPFESIADIEAYESATGFADGDDVYFLEGSTCTTAGDLDVTWDGVSTSNYSKFGCYDGDGDFECDGTLPLLEKSGGFGIIVLQSAQYIYIKDLRFDDTNSSWQDTGSIGIGTPSHASGGNGNFGYLIVENSTFTNFGHYAFHLAQMGSFNIFVDNTISDSGNGIYFIDEGTPGSTYNYIARNSCDNLVGYNTTDGHCIALQNNSYSIVEDNTATDSYNVHGGFWAFDSEVNIFNVFRNNDFRRNRQQDHQATAENSPGGYGNLIYGNIFVESADETSDRPSIWFSNYSDSRGNYAFNNTIYNAHYGGIGIRSTTGDTADYITYLNNIVVVDALTSNENELVWAEEGGTNNANFTIDYNLYWSLSGNPSSYSLWITPDDATTMTWANWKSDGWGGNDLVDNPDFVDTTNFELEPDSPAIDAGRFLTNVTSIPGSGTTINVANTYILHDDMGLVDADGSAVQGMLVSFYDNTNGTQDREITNITHGSSIVVDSSVTWIYNPSYPTNPAYSTQIALRMKGTAPDIGAWEFTPTTVEGGVTFDSSGSGKFTYDHSGSGKLNR